jgi:hypothetical protein
MMATKKKVGKKSSKRTVHRIGKPAPWAKSKMAQGTVTITVSLEHVFAALEALGKNLGHPEFQIMLRSALDQALRQKEQQKHKGKKKPARDPNLN